MNKTNSNLMQTLIDEMKIVFGADYRRIDHALAVLRFARQLQKLEGGDMQTVEAAAILHDIGIREAERKHGSSAGIHQELEGPPIARAILEHHDAAAEMIEHVVEIVGQHHSAKTIDTLEFRIVWDADWLVNIPEELGSLSRERLEAIIEKTFKTKSGREKAKKMYCQ